MKKWNPSTGLTGLTDSNVVGVTDDSTHATLHFLTYEYWQDHKESGEGSGCECGDKYAEKQHQHTSQDITDLASQLELKADKDHGHDLSDIHNLSESVQAAIAEALKNYSPGDHTHKLEDIVDFIALNLIPAGDITTMFNIAYTGKLLVQAIVNNIITVTLKEVAKQQASLTIGEYFVKVIVDQTTGAVSTQSNLGKVFTIKSTSPLSVEISADQLDRKNAVDMTAVIDGTTEVSKYTYNKNYIGEFANSFPTFKCLYDYFSQKKHEHSIDDIDGLDEKLIPEEDIKEWINEKTKKPWYSYLFDALSFLQDFGQDGYLYYLQEQITAIYGILSANGLVDAADIASDGLSGVGKLASGLASKMDGVSKALKWVGEKVPKLQGAISKMTGYLDKGVNAIKEFANFPSTLQELPSLDAFANASGRVVGGSGGSLANINPHILKDVATTATGGASTLQGLIQTAGSVIRTPLAAMGV